jgi:hypothetical protein
VGKIPVSGSGERATRTGGVGGMVLLRHGKQTEAAPAQWRVVASGRRGGPGRGRPGQSGAWPRMA